MKLSSCSHRQSQRMHNGFTLIEMMIAVAIIGILAAIALPAYQEYVRVARRADALDALSTASTAQEKYRVNNSTYASSTAALGIAGTSPNGYYNIALSGTPTATTYSFTATAPTTSPQYADTSCRTISINQTGTLSPADCAKR